MLSTVPGSSGYFPGGIIAYTGGLKERVLGVPEDLYDTKGSVSPEMAIAMADGARNVTGTDYAISVTGIAGPTGGRSGLPIGTFYLGLVGPDGLEVAERIHADAEDRDGNKRQAAQAAIDLLGSHLGA
jgi:nicotinamide-nucleotide amidase